MAKKEPKLILTATIGESKFPINLLNLKVRERVALEEHMGMPYIRIQSEDGWIVSEKLLTFAGYLAKRRRDPSFTYEDFCDLLDEEKATLKLGEEEDKPARPTKSRKTSGDRNTSKSE